MTHFASCETDLTSDRHTDVVRSVRAALEAIENGDRSLLHPDPWDPGVYEQVILFANQRGTKVRVYFSAENLEVEVMVRSRGSPLRVAIREWDFECHVHEPDDASHLVSGRLLDWLEALEHPLPPSIPSVREAARERAEILATAAAYAFGAPFAVIEAVPALRGRGLRLRLHQPSRTIQFEDGTSSDARGTMSSELVRLILEEPAWAHWTLTAVGSDNRRRCELVNIEAPRLEVSGRAQMGAAEVLRLIADHLPPRARLLWNSSERAPAIFFG